MVRGGGENLARTAYSVVRGLNRGHLSKLPINGVPNITGSDTYVDGFKGGFVKTSAEEALTLEDRLPEHYLHFYNQWKLGPSANIHQQNRKGFFEKDYAGHIVPVQNAKIPVLYPNEFHRGLWGGEGVVKGLVEPEEKKHKPNWDIPKEKYWMPNLFIGVVYSEVLNAHLEVTMTKRAQRLIDEAYGLDFYLLKTPVNEIYSHLGLRIKREILLRLSRAATTGGHSEFDSSSKFDKVLSKYRDFVVPHEVADWHGLPWLDAVDKLLEEERLADEMQANRPLKQNFRTELLDLLAKGDLDLIDPTILDDQLDDSTEGGPKFTSAVKNSLSSLKKFAKGKKD